MSIISQTAISDTSTWTQGRLQSHDGKTKPPSPLETLNCPQKSITARLTMMNEEE
jgi:hypothetical protein